MALLEETGEHIPVASGGIEFAGPGIVPVEDVIRRAGQVAIPNPPIDPGNPDRYESFSHPTDVVRKTLDTQTRRVLVESDITLADRVRLAEEIGPWAVRDIEHVAAEGEMSRGAVIDNDNPTANGGGVQYWLMNRIPLSRELGIDERWPLMPVNGRAVRVTKDWHNNTQGVAVPAMTLVEFQAGTKTYEEWIRDEVAPALRAEHEQADLIHLHDPQPHGLYDYLPPGIPTIWQSHIENRRELIGDPSSIQRAIWNYMWKGKVERANLHLFHPVPSFVPDMVPRETLGYHPAPFEPADDLNRQNVTEVERMAKREFWDSQLRTSAARKPEQKPLGVPESVDWTNLDYSQEEINWDEPFMAVIARFDAAKNLVSLKGENSILEHYARYREMMIAEGKADQIRPLVIAGNGSIDDPDGDAMLAMVMHARQTKYAAFKDDIKVLRVAHDDLAINVLMDEAEIGMQPSSREGFENRVSEWIWHGKPVIVSNRGGMPLQVVHGRSGFIEEAHDSEGWATRMTQLSLDRQHYGQMQRGAEHLGRTYNYREFSTVYAALRSYMHYNRVLRGMYQGDHRWRTSDTIGPLPEVA